MIKKINKILLKLKKDNKSLHQIDVSSKYLQTNFNFNYFDGHLTKNGNDRLFAFAKYIFNKEKTFRENKDDVWNTIISQGDHNKLIKYCLDKDTKKFNTLINTAGKTNLTTGFSNYFNYHDLSKSKKKKRKRSSTIVRQTYFISRVSKINQSV